MAICAALAVPGGFPAAAAAAAPDAGAVVDLRACGARGDGAYHSVREWMAAGRYRSLAALRRDYPAVDGLDWSVDEAAFARAQQLLPAAGGTILIPRGRYVAGHAAWRIVRDHVRLRGDGPDATVLLTRPTVADGLDVAPYRHVGWKFGAEDELRFAADSGRRGETELRLLTPLRAGEVRPGDLIFIRDGANRFDQDYGEFNEVAEVDGSALRLRHGLARDYTLARFNGAAETAADFRLPRPGGEVAVALRPSANPALPAVDATVSLGEALFRVVAARAGRLRLQLTTRGPPAAGTVVPAGTMVGLSRAVIRLTRTTRDFRAEGLQVVGRRKVLSVSNSYGTEFSDCRFVRAARDGAFAGGLTVDGDDGRFARFERCGFTADPPAGMQFARSFGDVTFRDCTFADANVAFTEFSFGVEVSHCAFDVDGTPGLTSVAILGKSCGGVRFEDNTIRARGVEAVIDAQQDIQSMRHGGEGGILVRGNTILTDDLRRVYRLPQGVAVEREDNRLAALPREPAPPEAGRPEKTRTLR